jgi:proline iminopeptidase
MTIRFIVAGLTAALVAAAGSAAARGSQGAPGVARESRVAVGTASLYARDIGQGPPAIVLHGGPDFDHAYLVPDLDRLADLLRLLYYDQRGRGQSAAGVQPDDVTLQSDVDDLDKVRQHFQLDAPTLIGHSWGTVLALEYALRYPTRVSRLILMNPAPASASDVGVLRKAYVQQLGADMERQRQIVAGAAYKEGDPEAVAARYRIHFTHALKRREDYEKLMATMKAAFVSQGKDGIVKARAVEDARHLGHARLRSVAQAAGAEHPDAGDLGRRGFHPGRDFHPHRPRSAERAPRVVEGLRALRLHGMSGVRACRARTLFPASAVMPAPDVAGPGSH